MSILPPPADAYGIRYKRQLYVCHWYCQVQPYQSCSTPVNSPLSRGESFADIAYSFEGIRYKIR